MSLEFIWLPMSVDVDMFKPSDLKVREVVLAGTVGKNYPVRENILNTLKNKTYFDYICARKFAEDWENYPIKDDFAHFISSSEICLTCGGEVNYPVAKYFEIPACETLLIAPWIGELGLLGFEDKVNMVSLDENNIIEQVEYYLKNDGERKRISSAGRSLICDKHSVNIRANQFVEYLTKYSKDPKILWLTIDRQNRPITHFDSFRLEVSKLTSVSSIVRKVNNADIAKWRMLRPIDYGFSWNEYDFVMCDAYFAYASSSWDEIDIPKGVLIEDVHGPLVRRMFKDILLRGVDIIFYRYLKAFKQLCRDFNVQFKQQIQHRLCKDDRGQNSLASSSYN